ncbi:TrfB-related DNA-binding protein [Xenorhabdus khoisanae]|uniref:TrfB-related DNA-binding protein n=1 Tax=Xenorhabdus khoisanae TaxID=880157 RepID=UPI00069E5556|nr:TrfB-related DNA-binding protein [Xenorhabdus khoisanae]
MMNETEFHALRPRLGRLTPKNVEVAEQVLVHGHDQANVARTYGLTRQRVNEIVTRVLTAASEIPTGWQRVEVWLPPELARQVRQMETEAKATLKNKASEEK